MDCKLPYYMAYPMPLQYDDEKLERRDWDYMKSIYPTLAKRLLPYVNSECERQEYECSMIYDEYPDKLLLGIMCQRIFRVVMKEEYFETDSLEEIQDLIEILVYQELCKLRCNRRKRNRKIY
ncbi:MAG: hypothetical protein RR275_07250 [Lachnospiraceae bacterium]